jgi:hypothetical protein
MKAVNDHKALLKKERKAAAVKLDKEGIGENGEALISVPAA